MRKGKYILLMAFGLLLTLTGFAQQDPHYSMYMFNGFVLNPAYAGSRDQVSLTGIARQQWVGIKGAPSTQSISINGPSRNLRHGWGFSLVNDKIAVTKDMGLNLSYAYRIPLGLKARLAFGIQGSLNHYNADFGGVRTEEEDDLAFFATGVNIWRPNAGTGIYFNNDWLYLGASIPRLINHELSNPLVAGSNARRSRHASFTGGLVMNIGPRWKFKPSTLVKYAQNAPWQVDINAAILWDEKIWLGASYRTEDAIVFMFQWNINKQFRLGYAYDYTTSPLANYAAGSHEIMIGYEFNFNRKGMISPRFF